MKTLLLLGKVQGFRGHLPGARDKDQPNSLSYNIILKTLSVFFITFRIYISMSTRPCMIIIQPPLPGLSAPSLPAQQDTLDFFEFLKYIGCLPAKQWLPHILPFWSNCHPLLSLKNPTDIQILAQISLLEVSPDLTCLPRIGLRSRSSCCMVS